MHSLIHSSVIRSSPRPGGWWCTVGPRGALPRCSRRARSRLCFCGRGVKGPSASLAGAAGSGRGGAAPWAPLPACALPLARPSARGRRAAPPERAQAREACPQVAQLRDPRAGSQARPLCAHLAAGPLLGPSGLVPAAWPGDPTAKPSPPVSTTRMRRCPGACPLKIRCSRQPPRDVLFFL